MKDMMNTLQKLPKSTLLPALGLIFFVVVAAAGIMTAQYQSMNRGPVAPSAPSGSQASGGICTNSWIAQVAQTPTPTPTPRITPTPTPVVTPTPTPGVPCEDCNYQVDAFIGSVIRDFSKPYQGKSDLATYAKNYGQGKRLIVDRTDRLNPQFPGCQNASPIGNNGTVVQLAAGCENPTESGKITFSMLSVNHQLGYATVKVHNNTGNFPGSQHPQGCTYPIGFVSYRANWSQGFTAQRVNDLVERTLLPHSAELMIVRLPANNENPAGSCTTIPMACTNQNQLNASMFTIPGHNPYPGDGTPSPDVVTYNTTGTLPAFYHIKGEMIEQGTSNIIFLDETGYLNPGQSITVNYPPVCTVGQTTPCPWGTVDQNGQYESHVTVNFSAMVQGQDCGNVGGNWDRYYSPASALVTVKNGALSILGGSRSFEVYAGNVKLMDESKNTKFAVPAGKTTTTKVSIPANATGITFKSLDGALTFQKVVATTSTGQTLFSLSPNKSVSKNTSFTVAK